MKNFMTLKVLMLAVLFLVGGSASIVLGQNANVGEIRGVVTDTSGAAIPGVEVTIRDVLTGVITPVTTNSSGTYDAPTLISGNYSITFAKKGFNTFTRTGITLGIQVVEVDAKLSVGAVTQHVTVTAPTPLVESQTSESSSVISSKAMMNLPNVGMTWYYFADLVPGAAPGGNNFQGSGVSINGSAPFTSTWLINGTSAFFTADNNNPDVVGNVSMDSIAEVKVNTSSYSAQYGNGSSVFNTITKTGTNQWHGSLFEFDENTAMNARNFFEASTSPYHWNEFGGTVGGPVKHNKAFFFFSYQDERAITYGPTFGTVPTKSEEQGDFDNPEYPTVYNPASLVNGVRTPLPDNTIPSSEISPWAAKAQSYWPQPNLPGIYNNYFVNLIYPSVEPWYSGNVQYHFSPANQLMVSVMVTPQTLPEPSVIPLESYSEIAREQQDSISDTWTISPSMVNEADIGMIRFHALGTPADATTNFPALLGELNPQSLDFPSVSINGTISTSIGPGLHFQMGEGEISPSDVLTIVTGKHIMKMGGEYDDIYNNYSAWGDTQTGNFSFSGTMTANPANPSTSGLGYADFLYGLPESWSVTEYPLLGQRSWDGDLYFEDDYKVRKDLTLNLGLRYGIQGGWGEEANRFSDFDPSITNPATNTLGALWYGGQDGRNTIEATNYHGFQPRVGFAWSPRNNWAVRGAYGIFDQVWAGANYSAGMGQGWATTGSEISPDLYTPIFSMSPPTADLKADYPSLVQGPGLPIYPTAKTRTASLLNGESISYYPYNAPLPYIQQAHLDIQHQMHGILVDAGYVWTRGIHLPLFADYDQVPADLLGPGNAELREPYPQYTGLSGNFYAGGSNYNAFELTVKRNFSNGLLFTANYTWSKAMDMETVSNLYGGNSGLIQNTYNLMANYGLGDLDMPNIFNFEAVYQLPVGRGKRFVNRGGILNGVIGGWQISSVLQVHSGSPFTPTMGTANLSGSLGNDWYPNRIANGTVPNPSISDWFNTAAFLEPAAYTFGNSGRDVLFGPSYKDLDVSLSKSFPIRKLSEGAEFEIRADAFDSLNNPNFGFPNASIGTSGVGVISSADTSRSFQLGAHFMF